MNISSPRLASPAPSGPTDSMLASPTPTDIQDNNSSHSDTQLTNTTLTSAAKSPIHSSGLSTAGSSIYPQQQQQQQHHQNNSRNNDIQRKNLKTEYKSNFTPFDQYVYNKVTDSFVKHANDNNTLLIESQPGRLSASNSNHDLASVAQSDHLRNSANAASSATSPALEFSVFEPNNGSDQHIDVTKEPWYKEVVRRNEKAHEYRFKSEVGHNSSLLMNASSNDDLISRKSPLINESAMAEHSTTGDDATTSSPAPTDELSSKRSYKFTPQDYKRDHLIATMADNNNFKLPKDEATSRATGASRGRAQLTSGVGKTASARPATRTPAQVRAKSQSSRLTSTTVASSSSSRNGDSAASKSNQTTPVKTATPRPMTAARTSTALTRPARPTTASTTSSRLTTTTTRTATSTNSAMKPASTVTSRRVPMSTTTSKTSTSTTTSRLAGTTSSGARTPVAGSTPRPTTARTTTLATSRTTTTTRSPVTNSSTNKAAPSTQAAPRSPVKRVTNTTTTSKTTTASSSRPSVATSARNSLSASKTPTGRGSSASTASTSSNAVKSIKTKALADAGEKATIAATTAAAAAAAATAATVMAVSGSNGNETQNAAGGSDLFASPEISDPFYAESVQEQIPAAAELTTQASQPIVNSYFNQEPNLIFNTSETGNMLADEIAQAEREANETYMKDLHKQSTLQDIVKQPHEVVAESEISQRKFSEHGNLFRDNIEKDAVNSHSMKEDGELSDGRGETKFDESHDLVNGLSGRITSAEDRYDSSERETSADYNAQQADQQEQDNDDEPYSIMPTTYDPIGQVAPIEPIKTEQQFDESKDELKLAEPKEETVHVLEAENIQEYAEEQAEEQAEVQKDANLDNLENDHLGEPTNDQLGGQKIDQLVEQISFEQGANETKAEDLARSGSDESLEKISDKNLEPEMPGKRVEFSSQPDIIESNHEHEIDDDHIEEPVKIDEDLPDLVKHHKDSVEPIDSDDADEEFEILDPERETIDEKAVSSEHSDVGEKTKPDQSAQVDHDEHWESKVSNVNLDLHLTERSIEVDPSALEDDEILELQESAPLEVEDNQHSQIVPQQEQSKHDSEFDEVVGQISSTVDLDNDVISKQDDKQHQQSDQVEPLKGSASAIDEQHAAGGWETNNKHEDSDDSGEEDEIIDHQDNKQSELLMNVADLVEAESRKKEEMIRKSELARQQSSSRTSLTFGQAGEILLSPDQLHEQITQSSSNAFDTISQVDSDVVDADDDADNDVTRVLDIEAKTQAHELENDDSQFRVQTTTNTTNAEESAPGDNDNRGNSTADLVDFGSIDSVERGPNELISEDDHHHRQDQEKPDQESHIDFVNEQTQSDGEQTPTREDFSNIDTPKAQVDEFMNSTSADRFEITNNQYPTMDMPKEEFPEQTKSKSLHDLNPDDDDDDEEEQLKLSNHLTNSDDDVILEPRNTKSSLIDDVSPQKIVSGSRYNEGAGLGMMAQDERVEGLETAEIADGLSAEIDNLTVAENRVEIATSKSLMPEISSAPTFVHSVARFAQSGGNFNVVDDDDDDEDLSLNPNADPIDVAATMSPSSSVAEEMLRLSRQASNASTTTNVTSKLIEELSSTTKNYAEEFARRGSSSHESRDGEVDSKEQVKSSEGETNTTITISPSTKVEEEEEKAEDERTTSGGRVELAEEAAKVLQNVGILSSEAANNVVINNNNDKFNDSISAKKPEQQNLKSGEGGGGGGNSDSEISDATSKAMGEHEASD